MDIFWLVFDYFIITLNKAIEKSPSETKITSINILDFLMICKNSADSRNGVDVWLSPLNLCKYCLLQGSAVNET